MNKHILLVMKWLNDKKSVTQEELVKNRTAAYADYASAAAADAAAADAAAADANNAEKWVNKYFERTGEDKQDYIDTLKPITSPTYTQAMCDAGELPSVGMECLILNTNCTNPKYIKGLIKYVGDLMIYAYVENGERCDNVKTLRFKPLTPPKTDAEKAIDDINEYIKVKKGLVTAKSLFRFISSGEFHGVTFTGEE